MVDKSNGDGPWGGGGQGGGPRGPQPPNIDELIQKGQESLKRFMPGGGWGFRNVFLIIVAAAIFWLATNVPYQVKPGEVGVELLFGKYVKRTNPGLNFWLPAPIGSVIKVNVDRTNTINVGFRTAGELGRGSNPRDVSQESLMLTGDQNIIDIDFVIQWRIKNAANYLFNIRNPEATVKIAAESAMREVIGKTTLEDALTIKRQQVQDETLLLLQQVLDSYEAGVAIAKIQLQKVDPPQEVIDAFNDVQRAKQDQERKVNEAVAYSNDIIPRAKGESQKMIQDAEGYRQKMINEAEGEAQRFLSIYDAYKENKEVTRRRIYLEKMQEVLSNTEKIIIDQGDTGQGVVPYLPLPELKKRTIGATQ